jgi:hypothetical protein
MRSQGELAFIDQMTRKMLVDWAGWCIKHPDRPLPLAEVSVYVEQALRKGWLTKKSPYRLTSKGWSTAASFLKR